MKRDKALGHDPLAWIKATREAESKQSALGGQTGEVSKPEGQETTSLEASHPEIKESDIVGAGFKPAPTVEEPQPVQKTIETRQERIHITPETKEGYIESRGRVSVPFLRDEETSPLQRSQKEGAGTSIIFIIAYAVLLLILTFFVYFNLSKRMDNMSSRIGNIEKALSQGIGNREAGK